MAFVIIVIYSWIVRKKFPLSIEDLMAIPDGFGASEENRIDISITQMEEVIQVSKQVQDFCIGRGFDKKRSFLAGLSLEETAANIVGHGFTKDKKKHAIDVRVSLKDDTLILRAVLLILKQDLRSQTVMTRQRTSGSRWCLRSQRRLHTRIYLVLTSLRSRCDLTIISEMIYLLCAFWSADSSLVPSCR